MGFLNDPSLRKLIDKAVENGELDPPAFHKAALPQVWGADWQEWKIGWDYLNLYEALLTKECDVDIASADPETDVVYFVQGRSFGPVKIGISTAGKLESRVKALQTGNPDKLEVKRTVAGDRRVERNIHSMLAIYRLCGEWFAPSEVVLRLVGQWFNSKRWDDYICGYLHGRGAGRDRYFNVGRRRGYHDAMWAIRQAAERAKPPGYTHFPIEEGF